MTSNLGSSPGPKGVPYMLQVTGIEVGTFGGSARAVQTKDICGRKEHDGPTEDIDNLGRAKCYSSVTSDRVLTGVNLLLLRPCHCPLKHLHL